MSRHQDRRQGPRKSQRGLCFSPEAWAAIRERFRTDLPKIIAGSDPFLAPAKVPFLWGRAVPRDCYKVLDAVCEVTKYSHKEVMGQRSAVRYARPRQILWCLLREFVPSMTDAEIARFAGRHQSSIAHGLRVMEDAKRFEPKTNAVYRGAKRLLGRA